MQNLKLSGESGKKHVLRALTESSDPWNTIMQLQQDLSLGPGRWEPPLAFLSALGVPYHAVMSSLLERVLQQTEQSTSSMNEHQLLALLRSPLCTRLLLQPELRSLPLTLLRQLGYIPLKMMTLLTKHNLLVELPLSLRRRAWESDDDSFAAELHRLLSPVSMPSSNSQSVADIEVLVRPPLESRPDILSQLKECIGPSELLFAKFCAFCMNQAQADIKSQPEMQTYSGELAQKDERTQAGVQTPKIIPSAGWWGGVMMSLISVQGSTHAVTDKRYSRLRELGQLLDSIRRQGSADERRLRQVVRLLRTLLMGQAAELERKHKVKLITAPHKAKPTLSTLSTGGASSIPPKAVESQRSNANTSSKPKQHTGKESTLKSTEANIHSRSQISVSHEKGNRHSAVSAYGSSRDTETGLSPEEATLWLRCSQASGPLVRQVLRQAWKDLTALDHNRIFADRVTDEVAPGYSSRVARPMDLGTILRRMSPQDLPNGSNQPYTLAQFDSDVRLMLDNCLLYNGPTGFYGEYARSFRREWSLLRSQLLRKVSEDLHDMQETACAPPKAVLRALLKQAWERLSEEDKQGVFARPVTDAEAPGYSREIARPMDLATALRRLDQPDGVAYKEQGGDLLAGFDADIEVMLANCVQYNGLRSDFGRLATKLQKTWRVLKRKVEASLKTVVVNTDVRVDREITHDNAIELQRNAPSLISQGAILAQALAHLLARDKEGIFAYADETARSVQTPMDLDTIRVKAERDKYKSGGLAALDKDVRTMVSNSLSRQWEPRKREYCQQYLDDWERLCLGWGLVPTPPPPPSEDLEGSEKSEDKSISENKSTVENASTVDHDFNSFKVQKIEDRYQLQSSIADQTQPTFGRGILETQVATSLGQNHMIVEGAESLESSKLNSKESINGAESLESSKLNSKESINGAELSQLTANVESLTKAQYIESTNIFTSVAVTDDTGDRSVRSSIQDGNPLILKVKSTRSILSPSDQKFQLQQTDTEGSATISITQSERITQPSKAVSAKPQGPTYPSIINSTRNALHVLNSNRHLHGQQRSANSMSSIVSNDPMSQIQSDLLLPPVETEGPLQWAGLVIRDPQLQEIFFKLLVVRLQSCIQSLFSASDQMVGISTNGMKRSILSGPRLPFQDALLVVALQLCLQSTAPLNRLASVDPKLLREVLPKLVLDATKRTELEDTRFDFTEISNGITQDTCNITTHDSVLSQSSSELQHEPLGIKENSIEGMNLGFALHDLRLALAKSHFSSN